MGPHYVDFTFAFDIPLIQLEMTEIYPKYEAQALASNALKDPNLTKRLCAHRHIHTDRLSDIIAF